jgi:hypothetical protein
MVVLKNVWIRVWGIGGGVRGLVLLRGRRVGREEGGGGALVGRGRGEGVMLGIVRVLRRGGGVLLRGRLGVRLLRDDRVHWSCLRRCDEDGMSPFNGTNMVNILSHNPTVHPGHLLSRSVLQSVLLSSSIYVSLCRNLCKMSPSNEIVFNRVISSIPGSIIPFDN